MEGGSMVVNEGDDALMGLPPGFRFHPTDEEIVTHYLTPKVLNRNFTASAIGEADLNKCEPWDLPKKAKMGEKEWFFFCQRDRKYPTGMRTNRATESGYWKATGKDKEIFKHGKSGNLVGMKKTLVFYKGRAPKGEKTNWVMHEFRLEGKFSYYNMSRASKEEWVVSRVFHKNTGLKRSPIDDHGMMRMNSFVDELLESPPWLPPLMDPPAPHFEPDRPGSSGFTASDNNDNNHENSAMQERFKGIVDSVNYFSYYPHDQSQAQHRDEDYKNYLAAPCNYNFNTNTFQASPYMTDHSYAHSNNFESTLPNNVGTNFPYTSGSARYGSCMDRPTEEDEDQKVVGQCKVEKYVPTTANQCSRISVSQDTGLSTDMTTEISSSSMISKHDMSMRTYDPDDHAGPSVLSGLDSLLEY